jgi:hypothetical protein
MIGGDVIVEEFGEEGLLIAPHTFNEAHSLVYDAVLSFDTVWRGVGQPSLPKAFKPVSRTPTLMFERYDEDSPPFNEINKREGKRWEDIASSVFDVNRPALWRFRN